MRGSYRFPIVEGFVTIGDVGIEGTQEPDYQKGQEEWNLKKSSCSHSASVR